MRADETALKPAGGGMRHRRSTPALWIAALLMVVLWSTTAALAFQLPLTYDEAVYLDISRQAQQYGCPVRPIGGGALHLNNPPLVTWVVAEFRTLGLDALRSLRLMHLTLWFVPGMLFVFLLARRVYGPVAGIVALLLLATQEWLLLESAVVTLDGPAASVSALGLLLAVLCFAKTRPTWRDGVPLAVTCALAGLIRYQGVLLGLLIAFFAIAARRRIPSRGPLIRGPAAWALLGSSLGLVTWILVAQACGGDLLGAIVDNMSRVSGRSDEPWFHRTIGEYWLGLGRNLGPLLLLAFFVSCLSRFRRTNVNVQLLLAWVGLQLVLCSMLALKAERYFLPALPAIAAVAAAVGTRETFARLDAKVLTRAANTAYRVTLGGLAGFALLTAIMTATDDHGSELNERYRRTASHVMALTGDDDRIMLSHPQVAYFARRHHFVSVFEPDINELLRVLDDPNERVALIVTDPRLHTLHPSMTDADRAAFWSYVTAHFEKVPVPDASNYWRRTSW